jgi:transcriptional regulator with GAF, ATPase, and Fis domain
MSAPSELIGESLPIKALLQEIEDAARTESKVLITGESGVGKEIATGLIHQASRRGRGPLVTINCAAITETLLESELFGHERGSFTGAYRDRVGLLELANRGTVFLDEIGEMSLRMQGLLLRFLETGEIQRVGSVRMGPRVDVRVIAATNRNLLDHVAAKTFRDDLFYRLNVFHIVVPPLRERGGDIQLLLDHFVRSYAKTYGVEPPDITPDARAAIMQYQWPGNIRELKNVVERLVVRSSGRPVLIGDLSPEITGGRHKALGAPPAVTPTQPKVADVLFAQLVEERHSFWSIVYPLFMARDLTRDDLRSIVGRGLERTSGNYKLLVQLFNMKAEDYKRFLNFLRKHQCHMPFQQFRTTGWREQQAGAAPVAPATPRAADSGWKASA